MMRLSVTAMFFKTNVFQFPDETRSSQLHVVPIVLLCKIDINLFWSSIE